MSFIKFILKRLLLGCGVLFAISSLTFFLLRLVPGDPATAGSDRQLTKAQKEVFNKKHGLDKPIYIQYLVYIKKFFKFDFGKSIRTHKNVSYIIIKSLKPSLDLAFHALFFAFVFGIFLGFLGAFYSNKLVDFLIFFIPLLIVSIPSFVFAGTLQYFFCVVFKVFPIFGYKGFWNFSYKVLPVISLGIIPMIMISRLVQFKILEILQQDYIKLAKSKGLPNYLIIWKHILKNSLIPVVGYSGQLFAGLIAGSIVIEKIFMIGGLGRELMNGVLWSDSYLVLGITKVYAVFFIVSMILSDCLYYIMDKRIIYEGEL